MQSTSTVTTGALRRSFTLIELLIVVAIIGILAGIAVPNFLNAQIRAKVARVQAELRTLRTAIESYHIDNNHYPPDAYEAGIAFDVYEHFRVLTTPIAYLGTVPIDNFFSAEKAQAAGGSSTDINRRHTYYYAAKGWIASTHMPSSDFAGPWIAYSVGPDQVYSHGEWMFRKANLRGDNPFMYDASNGLHSGGDIGAW